ncbi:MAG: serine/threonine protein kinase [Gemmatimonadetes bacterium]|nr:serine/threonine protein kinase [Gemmatimonadota bacterium]
MNESSATNAEFIALQQQVAGRYSLDRELGRGGMGIVLLARDVALDRLVAIKLLPPKLAIDADLRERFLREARTAAGLSHPNIVPIHAVEEHGDIVFFVMGYVDGETLRQRVERAGPITSGEAVRLIQEVAWALAHAHAKNIVHRDIKPDNILLDKATGRAMVTDFGIARVMDAKGLTTAGELLGTASYMSPEQAAGEAADARSDLYSLGVTAFYALTGKLPFDAETVLAVLAMHVNEPAPPIASVRADIPAKLAEAVDRCLMKDPAARFQSGEELAEAAGELGLAAKEIPPQIRLFMRDAGSPLAMLGGVLLGWFIFYDIDPSLIFVAAAALTGFGALFTLGVTRRVLRDGMNFDDLRSALVIHARARAEELEVRRRHQRETDLRKIGRPVGAAGAIGLAGYATAVIVFGASNVPDAVWGVSLLLLSIGGAILLVRKPVSLLERWGAKLERKTHFLGHRLLAGTVGRLCSRLRGLGSRKNRKPSPRQANRQRWYSPRRRILCSTPYPVNTAEDSRRSRASLDGFRRTRRRSVIGRRNSPRSWAMWEEGGRGSSETDLVFRCCGQIRTDRVKQICLRNESPLSTTSTSSAHVYATGWPLSWRH